MNKTKGIVITAMLVLSLGLSGMVSGAAFQKGACEKEAVKMGVARFEVNADKQVKFVWNTNFLSKPNP